MAKKKYCLQVNIMAVTSFLLLLRLQQASFELYGGNESDDGSGDFLVAEPNEFLAQGIDPAIFWLQSRSFWREETTDFTTTYTMCRSRTDGKCAADKRKCAPGFTGNDCNTLVCDMSGSGCNNGYCLPQKETSNGDENNGRCVCYPGWKGSTCNERCGGGDTEANCMSSLCQDPDKDPFEFSYMFFEWPEIQTNASSWRFTFNKNSMKQLCKKPCSTLLKDITPDGDLNSIDLFALQNYPAFDDRDTVTVADLCHETCKHTKTSNYCQFHKTDEAHKYSNSQGAGSLLTTSFKLTTALCYEQCLADNCKGFSYKYNLVIPALSVCLTYNSDAPSSPFYSGYTFYKPKHFYEKMIGFLPTGGILNNQKGHTVNSCYSLAKQTTNAVTFTFDSNPAANGQCTIWSTGDATSVNTAYTTYFPSYFEDSTGSQKVWEHCDGSYKRESCQGKSADEITPDNTALTINECWDTCKSNNNCRSVDYNAVQQKCRYYSSRYVDDDSCGLTEGVNWYDIRFAMNAQNVIYPEYVDKNRKECLVLCGLSPLCTGMTFSARGRCTLLKNVNSNEVFCHRSDVHSMTLQLKASPSPSSASDSTSTKKLKDAEIAGIAVGSVFFTVSVILLILWCCGCLKDCCKTKKRGKGGSMFEAMVKL